MPCAGVKANVPFTAAYSATTVQTAVDAIRQKAYQMAGIDAAQQRTMEDLDRRKSVTSRDTLLDTKPPYGPYAARPLYGIWAAAPFLHNGSVPTLYGLLSPPERRPKMFALGSRKYDPVKPGFVIETSCTQQDCLVDATRAGDGNGGHVWGTDLPKSGRMALLEYRKTY